MTDFWAALSTAVKLILSLDPELGAIVLLSLKVSLSAVLLATILGLPVGAWLALRDFPGRSTLIAILNALMGLPPVVVGLTVYLLLSRAGPLGELGLLFTPTAMIIAQFLLVTPIIAALCRQTIADLAEEYDETLSSLGAQGWQSVGTLLWEGRFSLLTAVLAGFGRATAEVGAVLMVGGNIDHVTRVMTTTIALETSKGNLTQALALGLILIGLVLIINMLAMSLRGADRVHH